MSQFADGGLLATKPYVSSAAYIDRQGDYCKNCYYDKKLKIGAKACPMNSLYWDFFARQREQLANNPRLSLVYRQLDKMPATDLVAITQQANHWRAHVEQL